MEIAMTRLTAFLAGFLVLVSFSFSAHKLSLQPAAPTPICGSIASTTTWTAGTYDVCASGASVAAGVTLTLDPGVNVTFQNNSTNYFYVYGSLIAIGTDAQKITFSGDVATPGSWGGIVALGTVSANTTLTLTNVVVNDGGINSSYPGAVYADRAVVTINHTTIENSLSNGFDATNLAQYEIHNSNFTGNGLYPLRLNDPSSNLRLTSLTASGNGTNAVYVVGLNMTMHGQVEWNNPGLPYIWDGAVANAYGDSLTIDPGITLQFSASGALNIGGKLSALGTADQPILMTGLTQTPGAWIGIYADGGAQQAVVQLDYVTIEYAGQDISGANIELANATLIAHYSIIRNSAKDGVKIDNNATASILNSQIYGNTAPTYYGIRNGQPARAILATNDYWGDVGGPRSDVLACPSGLGDKVTAGVLYSPIATAPAQTASFPLSNAPVLTLTPRRWFAPADNATRVYFDIALHDGNGAPLPGRTIVLNTNLGSALGGTTDALGKTFGYITSNTTGLADVTAMVSGLTGCETALSPDSQITFTTPVLPGLDLMPDDKSPYNNGDIRVSPMPVIKGVLTTIYATLTNPQSSPLTVNVEFDFVQSGIGLVFGPIATLNNQVIQANSSVTLSATFTPPESGHYCVEVVYSIVTPAAPGMPAQPAVQQLKPFNLNVQQPTTSPSGKDASLSKTRTSLKNVNRFVGRAYDNSITVPLAVANAGIEWDLNNAEKISNALQGDPPAQDYTVISMPQVLQLPLMPYVAGVPNARVDALNALDSALAQANAYGTAAALAFDRAGGAAEAADLNWQSIQTGVMLEDNQLFGQALITAAQKIDALLTEAAGDGVTQLIIPESDVVTMQQNLTSSGFSAQEIADAHALGLTDADIAAIRLSIETANPADLAGDVIANMHQISADFYLLGGGLSNPSFFSPGYSVTGAPTPLQPQATGNTMAQAYDTQTTIVLANPNSTPATINLSVRRLDLPADWSVDVTPAQVTLAGNAQTTVTVTIVAGSPVPQGSVPEVAVEGYIGTQLLGGVTIEVTVPIYWPFNGKLIRTYLPVLSR
jgi:hypothetical protein